jgi:tape measure domain-containing protein|tara:strand:- start:3193 stop:6123 length:2931 start_codon:yes stop_codon:yes gene_type:complete
MKAKNEKLIVELTAKIDEYVAGMENARRATEYNSKKMEASINKNLNSVRDFSKIGGAALLRFAGTVTAALSVAAIKRYADAWRFAQNRLRIVMDDQDDLASVSQKVVDVAIESRVSLEATALLYARMARTTKALNLTQADLARITETINKTFVVSGATATEATSSIIQLSQAFARGVLRGDEFRSVSEQAPVILEAITAATGKTRGELILMAEQGLLTTELIIGSLQRYDKAVDEAFSKTIPTITQAFMNLQTSVKEYVGVVDTASGITESVAYRLISFGKALRDLQDPTIRLIDILKLWIKQWDKTFGKAGRETIEDFGKIYAKEMKFIVDVSEAAVKFISEAFLSLPDNLKTSVEMIAVGLANAFDQVGIHAEIARAKILQSVSARETEILRDRLQKLNEEFESFEKITKTIDVLEQKLKETDGTIERARLQAERLVAVKLAEFFDRAGGAAERMEIEQALQAGADEAVQLENDLVRLQNESKLLNEGVFELQKGYIAAGEARKKIFEEGIKAAEALRQAERKPGRPEEQELSPPIPLVIGEEEKAADAFYTMLRKRQQKLRDAGQSEIQIIQNRFQRENEILKEKLKDQKITESQYAEQIVELQREKWENIDTLSLSAQQKLFTQQFLEVQNLIDARDLMMITETQFEERRTALRIKHADEQAKLIEEKEEKAVDSFITMLRKRQQKLEDANVSEIQVIQNRFERENEILNEKLESQKITEEQFAEQYLNLQLEKDEKIRQLSLSEQDRLLEQQFSEMQNLIDIRGLMLITETQFEERRTALRIKHANEQIKLAEEVRQAEVSIEGSKAKQIIGILKGLATGHKDITTALFLAEKAVAIAQIFIRTKEAAALALATIPPPAGFGVAAGIEAKGQLDMALVAATAIGGVVAASGGGGGGGAGVAISLPETAADSGNIFGLDEQFEKRISATITDDDELTSEKIRVVGIDGSKFEDFLVDLLNEALTNDRGQSIG